MIHLTVHIQVERFYDDLVKGFINLTKRKDIISVLEFPDSDSNLDMVTYNKVILMNKVHLTFSEFPQLTQQDRVDVHITLLSSLHLTSTSAVGFPNLKNKYMSCEKKGTDFY